MSEDGYYFYSTEGVKKSIFIKQGVERSTIGSSVFNRYYGIGKIESIVLTKTGKNIKYICVDYGDHKKNHIEGKNLILRPSGASWGHLAGS